MSASLSASAQEPEIDTRQDYEIDALGLTCSLVYECTETYLTQEEFLQCCGYVGITPESAEKLRVLLRFLASLGSRP